MSKKRLTSWQKRRIRRIKRLIKGIFFTLVFICFVIFIKSLLHYKTVDLCDLCDITYGGYNNKGSVNVELNDDSVASLMQILKDKYQKALFKVKKCESEDYNAFYNSLSVEVDVPENLSNGMKYTYTVKYDVGLANKIRLGIKKNKREVTVAGLNAATVIKYEDLFKDVDVIFEGVSPNVSAHLENKSDNYFVKDMIFLIEDYKEKYSIGEEVKVRAYFTEEECLEKHCAVDRPSEECVKTYTVTADTEYVRRLTDLSDDIIKEAVESADIAFIDETAREFGVRVYIEAGLVPVYQSTGNKMSTFQWKSKRLLSGYFKAIKSDVAGAPGTNYNILDLVYECVMTQADGVTCSAETIVRYTDIIKNSDGTYEYDFSEPKIISSSHYDNRIKSTLASSEDDYNVEKIDLSDYK